MRMDEVYEIANATFDRTHDGRMKAWDYDFLQRFAKVVAAREREACAQICDRNAESSSYQGGYRSISDCAMSIRARSNT